MLLLLLLLLLWWLLWWRWRWRWRWWGERGTTMKGARPCRECTARQKRVAWKTPVATSANSTKPGSKSAIKQQHKKTKSSPNQRTKATDSLTTSLACVSFLIPQSDRATRQPRRRQARRQGRGKQQNTIPGTSKKEWSRTSKAQPQFHAWSNSEINTSLPRASGLRRRILLPAANEKWTLTAGCKHQQRRETCKRNWQNKGLIITVLAISYHTDTRP